LNLLSNACKFTEKGVISVKVERAAIGNQESLRFRISDTGIGIDAKQQENLFREFSQADTSISRKYGGTGLGLAISYRFIQIMRGTISVDSQPGQGSTFTVQLPAQVAIESGDPGQSQPLAEAPAELDAAQQDRGTVLVIDDDPVVRELMSRSLTKLGFRVVAAKSGMDGLKLAAKLRPLLITLDVMMPEVDGWNVLKQLKETPETAEIPVIMVTIVDNEPMGVGLGASGYIIKPVDRDRLAVLVEKYGSHGSNARNVAPVPAHVRG
jgi:CheY-like chemotaxis protein